MYLEAKIASRHTSFTHLDADRVAEDRQRLFKSAERRASLRIDKPRRLPLVDAQLFSQFRRGHSQIVQGFIKRRFQRNRCVWFDRMHWSAQWRWRRDCLLAVYPPCKRFG